MEFQYFCHIFPKTLVNEPKPVWDRRIRKMLTSILFRYDDRVNFPTRHGELSNYMSQYWKVFYYCELTNRLRRKAMIKRSDLVWSDSTSY